MKQLSWRTRLVRSIAVSSLFLAYPAAAQVVPDSTLPVNSAVDTPDCTSCIITGGTQQGSNLFHSFSQFSIPTDGEAIFNNLGTIENIYGRVTGLNATSEIDGLIQTNDANLILINPAGFIFRENAQLDINGSFLATSASTLRFSNGSQFTAVSTSAPYQLTVTAPVGLDFSPQTGDITVELAALEVPLGETLSLVGGALVLDAAFLAADGGRVELGSVAPNSSVGIAQQSQGWNLSYDEVANFQDITLSNAAFVDASGDRAGSIQLQGQQIDLSGDAGISASNSGALQGESIWITASESLALSGDETGIFSETFGNGKAGNLMVLSPRLTAEGGGFIGSFASVDNDGAAGNVSVIASESVTLIGTSADGEFASGFATVAETGDGSTITLNTGHLTLRDGAQITASTFGTGKAGDLVLTVNGLTELAGTAPDDAFPSALLAQVEAGATGDGGQLTLTTQQLIALDGAQISTAGRSGGRGGILTINASDTILLSGTDASANLTQGSSGLFASAEAGSTQDGGNLAITTGQLTVENGAKISVDTLGAGQAGTATINVDRLLIREGGLIRAGSFDAGAGNTLVVDASESIDIVGTGSIGDTLVRSSLFTAAESTGNGGSLRVTSPRLNIREGGEVNAQSLGQGAAGNIFLTIPVELRVNNADIRTDAVQSTGGSITIEAGTIQLSGDGDIRTNVASGAANGGTILVQAEVLVALDDSDILAFAADGAGGDVTLPAFFGQNFEPAAPNTDPATLDGNNRVDVNATGQLASGTIIFPDVSFIENSLSELPDAPIATDTLVASSCIAPTAQDSSRLVLTGADGIPQQPGGAGIAAIPTGAIRTLSEEAAGSERQKNWTIGDPIDEPQAVYQLNAGRLVLSRRCLISD